MRHEIEVGCCSFCIPESSDIPERPEALDPYTQKNATKALVCGVSRLFGLLLTAE